MFLLHKEQILLSKISCLLYYFLYFTRSLSPAADVKTNPKMMMKILILFIILPLVRSLSEPGVWNDVKLNKVKRFHTLIKHVLWCRWCFLCLLVCSFTQLPVFTGYRLFPTCAKFCLCHRDLHTRKFHFELSKSPTTCQSCLTHENHFMSFLHCIGIVPLRVIVSGSGYSHSWEFGYILV